MSVADVQQRRPGAPRLEVMALIVEILKGTPAWVYLLLAFLVWQGYQATRERVASVWRVMIVPTIFVVLGLSRLVAGRDEGVWPPAAWLTAACVLASLGYATGPRLVSVDRTRGLVTRPGSFVPLLRNVLVFVLQYGVAVETALNPDGHLWVSIVGRTVSGGTAGYFLGWAVAFRRRYRLAVSAGDGSMPVS